MDEVLGEVAPPEAPAQHHVLRVQVRDAPCPWGEDGLIGHAGPAALGQDNLDSVGELLPRDRSRELARGDAEG